MNLKGVLFCAYVNMRLPLLQALYRFRYTQTVVQRLINCLIRRAGEHFLERGNSP